MSADIIIPSDNETEMEVLGCMMCPDSPVGDVLQILDPDDGPWFYDHNHNAIFSAIVSLWRDGEIVNLTTVKDELFKCKKLEAVGGIPYLVDLSQSVSSPAGAPSAARIVREQALLRRTINAGLQITSIASEPGARIEDVAEAVRAITSRVTWKMDAGGARTMGQEDMDVIEAVLNRKPGETGGLPTGLRELDAVTHGLQPGNMVVVGGRPGSGKTALAVNVAGHLAVDLSRKVGVFSLEMARAELWLRLACARKRVSYSLLTDGRATPEDKDLIRTAVAELQESSLYIDETQGMGLLGLLAKAKAMVSDQGVEAIFIDYLQLLCADRSENRQQEVADISRSLKCLAHELKIPVVVLSQLNRGVEDRVGHRPRLSDIRESGAIEQDADIVILMHRPAMYGEEGKDDVAEAIVAKNRNGAVQTVEVHFDAQSMRFDNLVHVPRSPFSPMQPEQDFEPYQ